MELADGAWIFMAFIVFFAVALMLGLYTRIGSGINHHPYGRRSGGAPGADTDNRRVTGRDGIATISGRGTR